MAYTKQTWDTTSYVNPTRMNHIEDGIKNCDDNMNKVKQSPNITENKDYGVLLAKTNNDTEETNTVQKSKTLKVNSANGSINNKGHIYIDRQDGTTSSTGSSFLMVGNDTADGESGSGNSKGFIRLYGNGENYVQLSTENNTLTANRSINFPNQSGTVATTNDIATTRYLKKSETTGNTFYLQGKVSTWFRVCFAYAEYNVLFSGALNYNQIKKIGGETLNVSVDTTTGIVTFTGADTSLRNNTNVLVEEIPI